MKTQFSRIQESRGNRFRQCSRSTSEIGKPAQERGNLKIKSDDLSAIIMKFRNNVIAEIHLDYFQKPETRSCKIIGTKGMIVWNSSNNQVKLYNLKNNKWSTKLKIKNYKKNDMYKKELAHFINCIKQKKKSLNDISQGQYVLKIALGIIKSSKLKRVVTIEKK